MDFSLSPEQQQIRDEVRKLCVKFDDAYWLEKDRSGDFPHELHAALAAAGWLGIAMPEAYGGAGLGITEAVIMMQAIAESGAAMSGASAVHINIFGLQPVVVFGTDEQKRRMLPPLIAGKDKACFAVTEPDAGLDTTAIKVRAERRGDHYLLSGQKIWISTAQVANKILILARTTPLDRVKRKTEGLSLFSPVWIVPGSRFARFTRWAGMPSIPICCSSPTCGLGRRTGSGPREKVLRSFSMASIPSAYCSAPKPSGSDAWRSSGLPAMPANASSSIGPSA